MTKKEIDRELQFAWVAGIIDGEGSIITSNPKDRPNPRIEITVSMTHEETIRRLLEILEVGTVIELSHYVEKGYKKQYRWKVESHEDTAIVFTKIGRYLVTKKEDANKALKNWHDKFDPNKSRTWKKILATVKERMPLCV